MYTLHDEISLVSDNQRKVMNDARDTYKKKFIQTLFNRCWIIFEKHTKNGAQVQMKVDPAL